MKLNLKYIVFAIVVLGLFGPSHLAAGQVGESQDALFLPRGSEWGEFSLGAIYQTRSIDDVEINELSFPIAFRFPLSANFGVSFASTVFSVSPLDLDKETAVGDAQVQMSYSNELGGGVAIYSLTANLPTGDNLNGNQFDASLLMSQQVFDLGVSGFGRGFILKPAATWAYPFSESLVFGFGASFLRAAPFKPLRNSPFKYRQGSEVTLTTGFDARIGPTTTVAIDATYSFIGNDKVGSEDYFEPEDRFSAAVRLIHFIGKSDITFWARYRTRGEGNITFATPGFEPGQVALPELYEAATRYTYPLGLDSQLETVVRLRHHGETSDFNLTSGESISFDSITLLSIGGTVSFRLSPRIATNLSAQYTLLGVTGADLGIGIKARI